MKYNSSNWKFNRIYSLFEFNNIKLMWFFVIFFIFTIFYTFNIFHVNFNSFDSHLHRLNSGKYEQENLPNVVKEANFPTNFKQIHVFNRDSQGRLSAWPYIGYLYARFLGQDVALWRIPLVIVFILTLFVIFKIGVLFENNKLNIALFALFFYILFWRYLIIEHIYDYLFATCFLLLVFYIELKSDNKGLKENILIAVLVFASLFMRELTILAIIPLGIYLFFNLNPIKAKEGKLVNFRSIIPYFFGVTIYFLLYILLIPRNEIQYTAQIDTDLGAILVNLKNESINIISLGIVDKHYEFIIFLSGFFLFVFVILLYLKRFLRNFRHVKTTLFLSAVVFSYIIGYSFIETTAYFFPYLAMALIYLLIFQDLLKVIILNNLYLRRINLLGIFIVFTIVGVESLNEMEHYRAHNKLFYKTAAYIANNAKQNSCIELNNFGLSSRYTFVTDIFISFSRADLEYIVSKEDYETLEEDSYAYYYTKPFISESLNPDYEIYHNCNNIIANHYQNKPHIKITERLNNFFISDEQLTSFVIQNIEEGK